MQSRLDEPEDNLPQICESCLGNCRHIRMQKLDHGRACAVCEQPFTTFRWQPGGSTRYKNTVICGPCARMQNVCQVCIFDLETGLPVSVREFIASEATGLKSDSVAPTVKEHQYNKAMFQKGLTPGQALLPELAINSSGVLDALQDKPNLLALTGGLIDGNTSTDLPSNPGNENLEPMGPHKAPTKKVSKLFTKKTTAKFGGFSTTAPSHDVSKYMKNGPDYRRNQARVCTFFLKGTCNRGLYCPYLHDEEKKRDYERGIEENDGEKPKGLGITDQIRQRYRGVEDELFKRIVNNEEIDDKLLIDP